MVCIQKHDCVIEIDLSAFDGMQMPEFFVLSRNTDTYYSVIQVTDGRLSFTIDNFNIFSIKDVSNLYFNYCDESSEGNVNSFSIRMNINRYYDTTDNVFFLVTLYRKEYDPSDRNIEIPVKLDGKAFLATGSSD